MAHLSLPFSVNTLQDALRIHLAQPYLTVADVSDEPLKAGVSGSLVHRLLVKLHLLPRPNAEDTLLEIEAEAGSSDPVNLVLKSARQSSGLRDAILDGADSREVYFYQHLAPDVYSRTRFRTPRLVLGDASAGWMLMEAVSVSNASLPGADWKAHDYKMALQTLAALHAGWWEVALDQHAYPWLWRPTDLSGQAAGLLADARVALDHISKQPWRHAFLPPRALRRWQMVLEHPEPVLRALASQPQTLLHGDYWPGNVSLHATDVPAVFDWQLVGSGPAQFDLAGFYDSSRWWFGDLPISSLEFYNHYIGALEKLLGRRINRQHFAQGLAAVRVWRFATMSLIVLARDGEWLQHGEGKVAWRRYFRSPAEHALDRLGASGLWGTTTVPALESNDLPLAEQALAADAA